MSLTYAQYVTDLATLMAVSESSAANAYFVEILPSIIDYAEGRIYRELDLLTATVRDSTASLSANTRTFTLPSGSGRFVVVEGINVYVDGERTHQLVQVAPAVIDALWPSSTAASSSTVPQFWATVTDQTIVVGPPAGATLAVEVVGKIRPTALSASNTTTFLSSYLPDLFLAASMVFASGYMKNFGAQSDDPKMAQSWEAQYQQLRASANAEEMRKKFATAPRG